MKRRGMSLAAAAACLMLSWSLVGAAAIAPQPGPGDPRIRVVHYDPNEVVELEGAIGYQMSIEFGPGERIENVSIGDGLGWQVTPNHKANLLFLKPLDARSATDMTVVTNLRRYVFDLSVRRPARRHPLRALIYRVRFEYPEPFVARAEPAPVPPPQPPADVNHAYRLEGSAKTMPRRVFDDGHSTYFDFPPAMDYPAIFAVDADRKEAVVNSATRDGLVVVDRLAGAFVLRRGAEVTRVTNDGYQEPGGQTAHPARRHKHRRLIP
jgi:type IV secretion system protein VirB9